MPRTDFHAMNLHLKEISAIVVTGAHAVLVLDGAGWHKPAVLIVSSSVALLILPPYSPELNPTENVETYIRANKLAISIFDTYENILDACCIAWSFFSKDQGAVKSITM